MYVVSESGIIFRGKILDNGKSVPVLQVVVALAESIHNFRGAPKGNPFGGDGGEPNSPRNNASCFV